MGLKICVGIPGSIAAYRGPDLVKELQARGHEVRVALTRAGREFVSPRVLETFSGQPVLAMDPFDPTHFGTDHIAVARWAEVFVIYGATADFIARYACGLADDFLCLQLIATRSPVLIAPAMNPAMWEHPSVQRNLSVLRAQGAKIVGPAHGKVACGETGLGHIADLGEIADEAERLGRNEDESRARPLHGPLPGPLPGLLQGRGVLISAGPMRSPLDPVRFIQNRSSGRMGLELARVALRLGARVRVLLGPVEPARVREFEALGIELSRYESPGDYEAGLSRLLPEADAFLSVAAVLDFEARPAAAKIERAALTGGTLEVSYRPVPDFVGRAGAQRGRPGQKVIAFAAETGTDEEIVQRATAKMLRKKVDALVANPVRPGLGPEAERNEVWILKPGEAPIHLGPAPKSGLAEPILRSVL